MENYSKSEILQMVEEEDVEFIRLQFTDMFGVLKNVAIPSSRLIKAMENRCTIDTASLDGFTGEGRAEEILTFRDALRESVREHAGEDAVTFLGGATGL